MAQVTGNCTHADKHFLYSSAIWCSVYILLLFQRKKRFSTRFDTEISSLTSIAHKNRKRVSLIFEYVLPSSRGFGQTGHQEHPEHLDSHRPCPNVFPVRTVFLSPKNIKLIPGLMWAHINRVKKYNPLSPVAVEIPATAVNALPISLPFCVCTDNSSLTYLTIFFFTNFCFYNPLLMLPYRFFSVFACTIMSGKFKEKGNPSKSSHKQNISVPL